MKVFMKIIIQYCIIIMLCSILFAISFRLPLYKNINVYFYRAILLLFTVSLSFFIILVLLKKFGINSMDYRDIIISDMTQNENHIFTKDEIENRFLDIYVNKYAAMEQRIEEQIVTGTIEKVNNGYRITDKAKNLINIFKFISII